MTQPPKAKKTARNQPVIFDESLSATLPASAAQAPATRQAVSSQRIVLAVVWVLAALTAGIGVGLLIKQLVEPVTFDSGTPIATAELRVTSAAAMATAEATIVPVSPAVASDLVVTSATDITQAQAGNITGTLAAGRYQSAAGMTVLQPGFALYNHVQGTIGTTAAR